MSDKDVFSVLTVLVAACEQAVVELEELDPRRDLLLHQIEKTRDAAVDAARQLGQSGRVSRGRKLMLVERAARQARNEALHREVNERIAQMDKRADASWATDDETYEFLCECGDGDGCDARVGMTLPDYERVRQQDDRFAVVPGHENLGIERVVARSSAYIVVDKIAEVEPYVADDPRGASSR